MAGSKQTPPGPSPTELTVRKQSRVLEIGFDDGAAFSLPFELLRVYSPSAEVRGHGPGQETLQTGMREVELAALEPVGNYAVQPQFSDGHNTGIYSWDYLYWLGANQTQLWQDYLQRLQAAGFSGESGRDAPMVTAAAGGGHACGHQH
ncbi:gamma-butyrobetaine hydroxylase-like domain-containing protein [Undibacterium arcticum]|uniref:Gamma-butyrobetaine hydroxylase-like domain-containing protein n=1 Tax=Undibacterium arcticum TaxID=1762892 RepID=A0ABV7F0Z2_9BURK